MSKDPAFLFYPNDYLGGTLGFSLQMHGAYILLMFLQFSKGEFTEKEAVAVVGEIWHEISCKFEISESGKYYNQRLREELLNRRSYSESRKANRAQKKAPPAAPQQDLFDAPANNGPEQKSPTFNGLMLQLGEILNAGPEQWVNDEYHAGQAWGRVCSSNPTTDPAAVVAGAAAYKRFCVALGRKASYVARPGNWIEKGEWRVDWDAKAKAESKKDAPAKTIETGQSIDSGFELRVIRYNAAIAASSLCEADAIRKYGEDCNCKYSRAQLLKTWELEGFVRWLENYGTTKE
jgi:uncharacterized protein YdaU (DUF1376 family)